MRWTNRRQSTNVEDRRGQRTGRGRAMVGGGLGTVVILVVIVLLGGDPSALLEQIDTGGGGGLTPEQQADYAPTPEEQEMAAFVKVVLADTEDVWNQLFAQMGQQYQEPTLVMFTGEVSSACGFASAAVGPFYCPGDGNVYIDLGFFDELNRKFQAPGDFAQAYVVAHEVGHHVQNLLGISDKVHQTRNRLSEREANEMSVRLELQADFFAGVWAHHAQKTKQILEVGDIEEALRAATAIGDDRLQLQSRGYVVPDSFTHGTSEQRVRWFRKGFETGDMSQGDTFNAREL